MSIVLNVTKAVTTKVKSFSDFYLPSEPVAQARRDAFFPVGTTANQAAAVIIPSAIAIAAAPQLIGAAGGVRALASGAGNLIKTYPKTSAATILAGPSAITALAYHPQVISNTASGYINLQGNLINAAKQDSLSGVGKGLVTAAKENPVLTSVIGGAGLIALGKFSSGLINAGAGFFNTKATNANTKAILDQALPPSPVSNDVIPPPQGKSKTDKKDKTPTTPPQGEIVASTPILPQTQAQGSTGVSRARKRYTPRKIMPPISFRVNIMNNNQSRISTKRYISGY